MKRSLLLAAGLLFSICSLAAGDTIGVYFRFNESVLPDEMIRRLDSALIEGPLNRAGKILIIGHTDAIGGEGYNLQLSRLRATAVKRFLTGSGIQAVDIQLLIGIGEQEAGIAVDAGSRPQDRRVDVVLLPLKRKPQPQFPEAAPEFTRKPIVPPPPGRPGIRRDSATTLVGLDPGESLLLREVFFYPGRHLVRPESFPALEKLLQTLLDNPKMVIRVEGHVCCISANAPDALDEDTQKLNLSESRAVAIRRMLIERGIDGARIRTAGFGRRFPVFPMETNEDEANRNRRVEIRVVSR